VRSFHEEELNKDFASKVEDQADIYGGTAGRDGAEVHAGLQDRSGCHECYCEEIEQEYQDPDEAQWPLVFAVNDSA
jgi:hypothetical protein